MVNLAHGDAEAFAPLLEELRSARRTSPPRGSIYESVDEVLKKASEVIVDTSGKGVSSVVPYLPMSEFRLPAPTA